MKLKSNFAFLLLAFSVSSALAAPTSTSSVVRQGDLAERSAGRSLGYAAVQQPLVLRDTPPPPGGGPPPPPPGGPPPPPPGGGPPPPPGGGPPPPAPSPPPPGGDKNKPAPPGPPPGGDKKPPTQPPPGPQGKPPPPPPPNEYKKGDTLDGKTCDVRMRRDWGLDDPVRVHQSKRGGNQSQDQKQNAEKAKNKADKLKQQVKDWQKDPKQWLSKDNWSPGTDGGWEYKKQCICGCSGHKRDRILMMGVHDRRASAKLQPGCAIVQQGPPAADPKPTWEGICDRSTLDGRPVTQVLRRAV